MHPNKPHPHHNTFGSMVENRSWSAAEYRFGYGRDEMDNEVSGTGNVYCFGGYGLDTRLNRRFNLDPQASRIAGQSPYSVNNNNPNYFTDPDGEFGLPGAVVGAIIGAGAAAIKMAISDEKVDWTSGKTWAKIGLGAATGAAIGALPVGALAAGSGMTTTLVGSSLAAGGITATSTLVEEGIDRAFDGEDVLDLKSYDYKSAGVNGVISSVSFGIGGAVANKLSFKNTKFLWTSTKEIRNNYGVIGSAIGDVSKAAVEGLVDRFTEYEDIQLPEVTIKVNRETNETEVDRKSLEDALDAINQAKPKRILKRKVEEE